MRKYVWTSASTGSWVYVEPAVLITGHNIAKEVQPGDYIKLGIERKQYAAGNTSASYFSERAKAKYHDHYGYNDRLADIANKGCEVLFAKHYSNDPYTDYIVIRGMSYPSTEGDGTLSLQHIEREEDGVNYIIEHRVTIDASVPKMDFVVESNNRLWGCRYGANNNGDFVNEIYASKLGEFKIWNYYQGTALDSYTASCGTDGAFTGAISYLGYPLFFKENFLHKVYGAYPAQYQINAIACRGVVKGAGASLAIVGERLYHKSRSGVCMYDGSLPTDISSALGDVDYSGVDENMLAETTEVNNVTSANPLYAPLYAGAVAGADERKYYICMRENRVGGAWHLFVYDTFLNVWHREDNLRCDAFCFSGGLLYFIEHSTTKLWYYSGEDDTLDWYVVTGDLGLTTPDKKYVSRVTIRLWLKIGAHVSISIQHDNKGEYQHITTVYGSDLDSISVPIHPRRCDHFRLKLEGRGVCRLYSISKVIEEGSDK